MPVIRRGSIDILNACVIENPHMQRASIESLIDPNPKCRGGYVNLENCAGWGSSYRFPFYCVVDRDLLCIQSFALT